MIDTAVDNATGEAAAPLVLVVDDDLAIRNALSRLLRSVGFRVEAFASAQEFLDSSATGSGSCLVLDIRMPRVSGLDFQGQLARAGIQIPIVFMTGHGDIPMTVQAMKAGAVDFLSKPFRDQDMLDAVSEAIERDRQRREGEGLFQDHLARHCSLSEREQQVMAFATSGLMNKQIAFELGIKEITVKIHRRQVMRKMGAHSFAELVRMADLLSVRRDKSAR